jgi:hypothetical protein
MLFTSISRDAEMVRAKSVAPKMSVSSCFFTRRIVNRETKYAEIHIVRINFCVNVTNHPV